MTSPVALERLLAELRVRPRASALVLRDSLGLKSQATFSRLVTSAGDRIVPIGRARARSYAAARDTRGLGRTLPVFRVGASGTIGRIATLRPFAPDGCLFDDARTVPAWMRGRRGDGSFDDLPPFILDARPAGFLGRAFARGRPDLGLPADPGSWSNDDVLVALARAGDDASGDLVLGDESVRKLYETRTVDRAPIALARRGGEYPRQAELAIAGIVPGASIGGEQPKFTAFVDSATGPGHVLVKFSPAEFSDTARRWCDLIVCEHLALETLREAEVPVASTDVVEAGSRVFLEASRFDRVGAHGRRPVVSLAALQAEYVAAPASTGDWIEACATLGRDGWLRPGVVEQVRLAQAFGGAIANTDMHAGNLSFLPVGDDLDLAPVYDMLPMGYAPVAGEVPAREFRAPPPRPGAESPWFRANELAVAFWRRASEDERISPAFQRIARDNADIVARTVDRIAGRPG
jgi:hypothetical protein